ncbi:hypothetical protein BDY24DRAFT_197455 [Mrakia frigida]|uniref:uncharacterized protein n=1 Tax=Mrakia frigida TaxID=29902 RepID=UPI003FCC21E0
MDQVVGFYNMFPDLIKATIVSARQYDECWHDWEGSCLKSTGNPRGVPIQDLFIPQFFGRDAPLPKDHAEWALVPEDIRNQNNTYIGYSIEDECMKRPFVPTEGRPRQVWILGKLSKFFTAQFYPYSRDVWVRASQELNVEFVSAFNEGDVFPGIRNLRSIKTGPLFGKEEFEREIGQSLAIVGLGDPPISPTPWYGLCYGTPFLNPVKTHLEDDGTIRIARSQHPHVGALPEPHVYNVPQSDRADALVADDQLIEALRKAITAHERFIPEAMRQDAMNRRVMEWLNRDWKGLMAEKMEAETDWVGEAKRRELIL